MVRLAGEQADNPFANHTYENPSGIGSKNWPKPVPIRFTDDEHGDEPEEGGNHGEDSGLG
jgi:hypothetical protein